jgi:AcrR family transcriptional regulator
MSATAATDLDQRGRILGAALELMAADGSAAVSMRRLAKECGLNVATLYHYFPSKADLLRSVLADRQYHALLEVGLPVDQSLPPAERLAELLRQLWAGARVEEEVWRLVIGESLRSDGAALEAVAELVDHLRAALSRWLADGFPELEMPAERAAQILSGQVFGFFIEVLVVPPADPGKYLADRAAEIAHVLFPPEKH